MIGIKVKENENIDRALNRFKKIVTRSRVIVDYKERQAYIKPSELRRQAFKMSVRNERRRQREE
jgi:small subunit ribosomal protein S21